MRSWSQRNPVPAIALVTLVPLVLGAMIWAKIPLQDPPTYFDFADHRVVGGIPFFGDVISNLAFILVGLAANRFYPATAEARRFVGWTAYSLILTGVGSAYFHWNPNPQTLFWDRLPMVLLFGGVVGLVASERIGRKASLIAGGFVSVFGAIHLVMWKEGVSDLRPYLLLQFGAFLWLILVNLLFSDGRLPRWRPWAMLGLYAVAKFFEAFDDRTYEIAGFISGHTIKHLVAAYAVYVLLAAYRPSKSSLPHQ